MRIDHYPNAAKVATLCGMANHQLGIFHEASSHHIFLEFACREVRSPLPGGALASTPVASGVQVIAFGSLCLGDSAVAAPSGFGEFQAIADEDGAGAPATQQDLFIWLHGEKRDELFVRALAWRSALAPVADLTFENHGFRFRDNRDITGFVDGTANPKGDEKLKTALVASGPGAGGSFVLVQRWVHDLAAFNALPVTNQERVFGRTKADSVELTGDAKPADSHVSRTDLPGTKIYRRSTPVGGLADAGLYFLAFSADQTRFDTLLRSMYGLGENGLRDRMLSYTKPTTGSYYFAPPLDSLAAAFSG